MNQLTSIDEILDRINEVISLPVVYKEVDKETLRKWLRQKLTQVREDTVREVVERIEGIEEHNLSPNNQKHFCLTTDHNIMWDGNYYTCANCGWEFCVVASIKTGLKSALLDTARTISSDSKNV